MISDSSLVIIGQDSEVKQGQFNTPGYYSGSGSYTGTYAGGFASGTARTSGTYYPPQSIQFTKHGATAAMKMFKGEKPENAPPGVFNAREVMQYLGPNMQR